MKSRDRGWEPHHRGALSSMLHGASRAGQNFCSTTFPCAFTIYSDLDVVGFEDEEWNMAFAVER